AVAVLTLVESGKVKLDEPVTAYIKDFAVKEEERAVTVRDLLQMTSGLVDYSTADWDGREKEFSQLNLASHLEWVNDTEPTDAPGTKFHYNNTNYALLAQIVERVSGKSFSQYMKEKVFTPAGMTSSFVVDKLGMKYENPVTGYKNEKAPFVKSFSPVQMPGDGNVYSTIEDMAAWANAMRTNKIISAKTRAMAWSAGKLDDGKAVMYDDVETYGFGWKLNAAKKSVSHSGSWYGTAAYFLHYPELDDTVIVLSNNESLDVAALAGEIGDLF
ncbi:MAG: beta-lactamase family protein, partial [Pyrinomonadaceae bacterium]|nr:beta-lactamase family protein [Pyrinomonadaceae bacterium]